MQIEVELALVGATADDLQSLQQDLPTNFYIDDRSRNGWGLVICTSRQLPDDFSNAVDKFLEELDPLVNLISRKKGVLRVAVFYGTVTCTVRLNSSALLTAFNLSLEISSYPSSD